MKEVLCGNIKFNISVIKGIMIIKYGGKSYIGQQYKVILKINKDNKIVNKEFIYVFSITNAYFEIPIENIKTINQVKIEIKEVNEYLKYTGIVNLSNTCYANAFLQTLYFLPEFKKYIFNSCGYYALLLKRLFWRLDIFNKNNKKIFQNDNNELENKKQNKLNINDQIIESKELIEYKQLKYKQLKDIISESVSGLIKNLPFIKSVNEQHDIHEFSKMLFERLEVEDEKIKEIIEGKLLTIIQCECGCISKRIELFQDITLPLETNNKQFRHIYTSLEAFCSEEKLNGYCCEKHGKVKATKVTKFLKLPDVIFMLIPRFKIDWENGKYMKDNDLYEFTEEINFKKYCSNYIYDINNNLNKTLIENNQLSDISTSYKLYSVIVHSGVFEEGHFYTYLYLDNKYYKFNDEDVNEASKEEAVNWNYGGKYQENKGLKKRFSAYYLIYCRKILNNEKINNENNEKINNENNENNEKINNEKINNEKINNVNNENNHLNIIPKNISCIINYISYFYTEDFYLIGSWGPYGYSCDIGLFISTTPKETKKCLLFDNVSKIFNNMIIYKIENGFNIVKHEAIQNNNRYLLTKPGKGILIFLKKLNIISKSEFPLLPTISINHFNSFLDLINVVSEFMNIDSEKIHFFLICGIFLYEIKDFNDIQIGDTIIIAKYDQIEQIIFSFIFNLLKCVLKSFNENNYSLLNIDYIFSFNEFKLIIQNYLILNPVIFKNHFNNNNYFISENKNYLNIKKISENLGFICIFTLSNLYLNIPLFKQYQNFKNNILCRRNNCCQELNNIYHTHLSIIPHGLTVYSFISHLKTLPFSCCRNFSNKNDDFIIVLFNDNSENIKILHKNDIIEFTSSTLFIVSTNNNTINL